MRRTVLLGTCAGLVVAAAPLTEIPIPGARIHPESITATRGGDLIVGSAANGTIWRVRQGETAAKPWIAADKSGLARMLGVFSDDRANLLWVCALPGRDDAPEVRDSNSALVSFNLTTGAPAARYPMPDGAKSVCNDIAVAKDGTLYIAETAQGRVLRLRKGAAAIDVWLSHADLSGVDGIALDDDGTLLLTSVRTNRIFRTKPLADGTPGPLVELKPSRTLERPDGMRSLGRGRFIVAEANDRGGIALLEPKGDAVTVTSLPGARPGTVSAAPSGGRAWGVVGKLAYLQDPALKDQDPGAFSIYSVPIR